MLRFRRIDAFQQHVTDVACGCNGSAKLKNMERYRANADPRMSLGQAKSIARHPERCIAKLLPRVTGIQMSRESEWSPAGLGPKEIRLSMTFHRITLFRQRPAPPLPPPSREYFAEGDRI